MSLRAAGSRRPNRGAAWAALGRRVARALALALAATVAAGAGCKLGRGRGGEPGSPAAAAAADDADGARARDDSAGAIGSAAAPGYPFVADVAPVTALAVSSPNLWIGSARGLRRTVLATGETEWVDADAGMVGRRVSALAAAPGGGVYVATDAAVGHVSGKGRYRAVAPLANATHLAPVDADAAGGTALFAGAEGGLFFLDGKTATSVEAVRQPVTSLDADDDGKTIWVGARGHGLVHLDGRAGARARALATFGPREGLDFVDPVGASALANGTRFAFGRAADGTTRMLLVHSGGATLLGAQPETPVRAVTWLAGGAPAVLAAAPAAADSATLRLLTLAPAERGEVIGAGGFRLSPGHQNAAALRFAARPDRRALPPAVTAAAPGDGADDVIFAGTRARGVARAAAGARAPEYVPAGELALDARHLSVACPTRRRCLITTGAGRGVLWDDGRFLPAPGEDADGVGATAIAGDGSGAVYGVRTDGDEKALLLLRLAADGRRWESVQRLDVSAAITGSPLASSATLAPSGNLWISITDELPSGDDAGRGVLEVELPAGRLIHHRPYAAAEKHAPEALPVSGDVSAVRFGDGGAIWICSSTGVFRFAQGQLRHFGENEGLTSESCRDVAIVDGEIWTATADGPARFDGKGWRAPPLLARRAGASSPPAAATAGGWPVDDDGAAIGARALVPAAAGGGGFWAGTPKGLVAVPRSGGATPSTSAAPGAINRRAGLVDDNVHGAVRDRFGRLWLLGSLGVTLIDPAP